MTKYTRQKEWQKEHMKQLKVSYVSSFVDDFKKSCDVLGFTYSQVIRKAMQKQCAAASDFVKMTESFEPSNKITADFDLKVETLRYIISMYDDFEDAVDFAVDYYKKYNSEETYKVFEKIFEDNDNVINIIKNGGRK